jgi:hypothetical protein
MVTTIKSIKSCCNYIKKNENFTFNRSSHAAYACGMVSFCTAGA